MPIIVRFTTFKKRAPFRSATGGAADRPYFRITFHPQQAAAGQKNSVNPDSNHEGMVRVGNSHCTVGKTARLLDAVSEIQSP
jgi:hypothetical protein